MPDLHAFFIDENATVRATLQTLDGSVTQMFC